MDREACEMLMEGVELKHRALEKIEHTCDPCGRSFAQKAHLMKHMDSKAHIELVSGAAAAPAAAPEKQVPNYEKIRELLEHSDGLSDNWKSTLYGLSIGVMALAWA